MGLGLRADLAVGESVKNVRTITAADFVDRDLPELGRRLASGEAEFDSRLVAREIIEKMRIIRWVRKELEAGEAGRIRPEPHRSPPQRAGRFRQGPDPDRAADAAPGSELVA